MAMSLIDNYAIWVHAKFFLEEIREKVKRLKRVIRRKQNEGQIINRRLQK